ncbi:alpha/beta hydrolase family protein [Piscinibacter sakaiensis]|uniref:alpha/beta hydrolase family protein n=1 Tax=Piscinibacter sakaiensis TaxID=1547922 RepID=UPI003AACA74F
MATRDNPIDIPVGDQQIAGTLVGPDRMVPGVMLVHGWDGGQQQYINRAHAIAALGCICLTFDLRGHVRHEVMRSTVTREDNLRDVLAAYDVLVGHPAVDPTAIAIVGSSYGGYLAAILTSLRPVRWLSLRVPALYRDEDWLVPKTSLVRSDLVAYRNSVVDPATNRALRACAAFRGDVLLVESEHDSMVPHQVIENYRVACAQARSLTYRLMAGADHGLSEQGMDEAYTRLLVHWMTEMVQDARAADQAAAAAKRR